MRVLMTGGAGFIGSHVVDELLARGHEPFVFDNLSSGKRNNLPAEVPLLVGDIRDDEQLRECFEGVQPDAVCHLAAQVSVSRSVREPVYDAEVNVLGLLRVLTHAIHSKAQRFVFASSGGALYGDVSEPAGEDAPCRPASPYGIGKLAGEHYLAYFTAEHNITGVALRYGNVYGPRQDPQGEAGVVSIFSTTMLAGEAVTINGDGRYVRDYIAVDDAARATVDAVKAQLSEPFTPLNVGTGRGTDVNQLAAMMRPFAEVARRKQGRTGPIPEPQHGPPRSGDLRSSLLACAKIHRLLGWTPQTTLDEGLQQTVNWFAEHRKQNRSTAH